MPLKARLRTARYRIVTTNSVVRTQTHLRHDKDQSRERTHPRQNQASSISVNPAGPCTYQPVRIGIDGAGAQRVKAHRTKADIARR